MRLYNFLNEKEIFVQNKNLPDWVKTILKQHSLKKDVKVIIGTKADVGSKAFEYSVKTIYLYDKGKVKSFSATGSDSPFDTKSTTTVKKGFKVDLNFDRMVLTVETHPKMAILFVHPDSMSNLLPDTNNDKITDEELLCLMITKSLKSFARRQEAERYNINYDSIAKILINKGLLNKNGAINTKGKNLLLTDERSSGVTNIFNLANKLKIKDKY